MVFTLDELAMTNKEKERREELYKLFDEEVNPFCYDLFGFEFSFYCHRTPRGTAV